MYCVAHTRDIKNVCVAEKDCRDRARRLNKIVHGRGGAKGCNEDLGCFLEGGPAQYIMRVSQIYLSRAFVIRI